MGTADGLDWRGLLTVLAVMMTVLASTQGLLRNETHAPSKSNQDADFGPTETSFPEMVAFDHQVSTFLQDNHYTGATLGFAQGDEVLYTQGYGVTDEGTQMRPTTLLPISSLSKTITAVAVLKLVQMGDLKLSDRVFGPNGILSSFQPPEGMGMDPRLGDITVEHLLHHTAGWGQTRPRLYDPMMNSVYLSRGHDVINIAEVMELEHAVMPSDVISYMMGQPLDYIPGIKYEYSNFGYTVLGRVIEQVSGESYILFVRSQILKPLGMWHTRIGPHRSTKTEHDNHIPVLSFPEGDIPLPNTRSDATRTSYTLLDSTLGWWSTVYDLMRFVTGLTSGMVLDPTTLKLLTKHPSAPVSEHRDTWSGLGVLANEEDTWWQVGDSHDNEIILFHQESQATSKSRQIDIWRSRTGQTPRTDSRSWVVILSDNNRKNLKLTFSQMMSSVAKWPTDNLLIEDCGEYLARGSWQHSVLMNSHIRESHFPILINAASRLHYFPEWISAYNINQKTYFSAVFKRDTTNNYRITHGVTKSDLINLRTDNLMEGYYLNFVTSYNSYHCSGDICHTAIFGQVPSRNTQFGIGETRDDFIASLHESNLIPTTQSIASANGVKEFTYSLSDQRVHSWKSFDNLTLDQLEQEIRMQANMDRILLYLDSYVHLGEVLFSAVFSPGEAGRWQVQAEVRHNELSHQSYMFRGLHFRPRIMVGYECEGQPCFVIMWKKH